MSSGPISPFIESILPDYGDLQRYFMSKVGCEHAAKDLAQATFEKLLRWSPGREVGQPRRLLFRTARNLLIDRFRALRSMPEEELSEEMCATLADDDPGPARRAAANEELQLVSQAVARLPEASREVFVMNRMMGLSYSQISQFLSMPPTTVERHMLRAILACKQALKKGAE